MNRRSPPTTDASDFRRVVLPHVDGAYDLARYLTRDPVLSEDLVQDAVLRAFRGFDQFRGSSPRAWLFAIVRNCCRTAQAKSRGGLSLVVVDGEVEGAAASNEQSDPRPNPEELASRQSDIERVRAAIEELQEPFREAVVLRDLEDLSYAEIAEVTGVPIGTVMSRLSRGRAMLAKRLLPIGSSDDARLRSGE